MTILSDHAILRDRDDVGLSREGDAFELEPRLGTVLDIIRHKNTRTPLCVAIYGDWGTGKTSGMHWLADQLRQWSQPEVDRQGHKRVRTVWFDPWKFNERADVWRGLIAEVILHTIDVKNASLATVVSAAKKFGLFLGRGFFNVLSTVKLSAGKKELGGEVEVNLQALQKIAEDYRLTAHPEKAYLNEFETALSHWVQEALGEDERMVIFIDDLDRCLPAVTLEVLEALKLYLNIPKLVFVIGLDRDVVESVVRSHYKAQGLGERKADQYLDKMFQVEIDVPPSETQVLDYLPLQIQALNQTSDGYWSKCLSGWNGAYQKIIEDKIRDLADHNPREVKRLLNSTLLRGSGAARDEKLSGSNIEAQDKEKFEAQRFTQGCQVYLIQRVLRKFVPESGGLMREKRAWEFFEAWSEFLHRNRDFVVSNILGRAASTEMASEARGAENREARKEAEKGYERLKALQPRYRDRDEAYPLLNIVDLWYLMAIPFSPNVAASTAVERPTSKPPGAPPSRPAESAAPPTQESGPIQSVPARASLVLRDMPRLVLSAIAKTLNKSVDVVAEDDLAGVTNLDLARSEITDAGLTHLTKFTNLQELNLSGTQVSGAGVVHLGKLTSLQVLDLEGTRVTDAGLEHLAKLTNLQSLVLADTQVSDAELAYVAKLTNLQDLNLKGTRVGDAGLIHLTKLTNLQSLDLAGTKVGDAGLAHLAKLTNLQKLVLLNSKVTDAGLAQLVKLTKLQSLDLSCRQVGDAELVYVAKLTSLQTLRLLGTQVTDAGLAHLAKLTNLQKLYLLATQVGDAGLAHLATLTNLQKLVLLNTKVTDAGLAQLVKLTKLQSLNLLCCRQVGDAGLVHLAKVTNLQTLDVEGTKVSDAGVKEFKRHVPACTVYR